MATISNELVAEVMRHKMECKDALQIKGSFYVGTGRTETIQSKDIPETTGFDPSENNNGVLIRDTTDTNETGWRVAKITADNLEGGRVAQATNAEKAQTLLYNEEYKSFIDAFVSECLLKIYPIGSIYISVKDTDPATFLGGTWERWGQGRVPVGVKEDDDDFKTPEKEDGEKKHQLTTNEMPNHKHLYQISDRGYGGIIGFSTNQGSLANVAASGSNLSVIQPQLGASENETALGQLHIGYTGGNQSHNNLQPYITCYMWKRTA